MTSLIDAVYLFVKTIENMKRGITNLNSPLEEHVIRSCGKDLAYIDNRKDAKDKYNFDFWEKLDPDFLRKKDIPLALLYSQSQHFPDFLFKAKTQNGQYIGGSLIELKDSKGTNIASFNSTIPTKRKTLEEIDVINGDKLVSRIATIMDGKLTLDEGYFKFERNCFYLIRTCKENERVKLSIVDGSFFETLPKDRLFNQMLLNVLREHIEKKKVEISSDALKEVEKALSYFTDQTIIAKSQIIEKASVRPRLRIMAEAHPEGNPHGSFYPEVAEKSFNLILQSSGEVRGLEKKISSQIPEIVIFSIFHKRNGEHRVFQFRTEAKLNRFLR